MTTYKSIIGKNIKSVSTNITGDQSEGQIWFNTTENTFKAALNVTTPGAFSSGGTLPQIVSGAGSAGVQTAAFLVGGLQYPSDTKNRTYEYDGSSWTQVNNLPNNFFGGNSCGTQTAGFIFGSYQGYGIEEATYHYDGTNWTSGGSLPDIGPAYAVAGGGGTSTAAVACGGFGDPGSATQVLEYNGSSWTANPNSLPTGNYNQAGDGTATALWLAGGPSATTTTLHFDGTSFTSSGALSSARPSGVNHGWGVQTNAIVAGGTGSAPSTASELYNGSTWSSGPSMSVPRTSGGASSKSCGSQTGFICGGAIPPHTDATEEFTPESQSIDIKTLTQS